MMHVVELQVDQGELAGICVVVVFVFVCAQVLLNLIRGKSVSVV